MRMQVIVDRVNIGHRDLSTDTVCFVYVLFEF